MLKSYLHSSNNKRTEPLDSWELAMVQPLSVGISSGTVQGHASESLVWVAQSTLRTQHSWITWVDAKDSGRLRNWVSASLKSRKKVGKESQSKHPFSFQAIEIMHQISRKIIYFYNTLTSCDRQKRIAFLKSAWKNTSIKIMKTTLCKNEQPIPKISNFPALHLRNASRMRTLT